MLPVGSRGDYAAFQHHAGIPSIDLSFAGGRFPQNSCYDNYAYMKEVGDPTFAFHEAMAKVVILLLVELADTDIVSFNMEDYADALEKYAHDLQGWVHKKVEESSGTGRVDVGPLDNAIIAARGYIRKFTAMDEPWMKLDHAQMPIQIDDWAVALRRSRGIRMSNFDKHLLDLAPGGGVPGREWFKHMVQSPQVSSTPPPPLSFTCGYGTDRCDRNGAVMDTFPACETR